MTPNPVIRLTSVVQTLEHVVFPAVDPDNSLAQEQCGLVLAQLRMLIGHLPWIGAYHTLCHDDIAATAAGLPSTEGGPQTVAAAAALARSVAEAADGGDPLAGFHIIGTAIDTLLRAVAVDGAAAYRRAVERDVFQFSRRQSLRSRSWFRDAGFDPDAASVPDYADLISAG
ncbi:MAG: hypothetical protein V4579_06785 [Pseudomonadota bacterium]